MDGSIDRDEPIDHPLGRIYPTIAFYGVLAVFGVVFLGSNLPALVCYGLLPRAASQRLGQAAIMHGFRFLLWLMRVTGLARFDLTALDALRQEPGLVIAPNHPSLIDVVLVTSRLPRVVCIAKASLWDNPALGSTARTAGYIRNDVSQHRLVARAAEAIRAGHQLLIFPEGTRTAGPGPIGPMKGGFVLMARRAGAPIQTVLLESNTRYISKGWPLLKRPAFPLVFRARLGERFAATGDAAAVTAQIDAYFRRALARPGTPP